MWSFDDGDLTNFMIDNFNLKQFESEIIDENNYYPFGLKHKGYNGVIDYLAYNKSYLGQEENEELGLNWLTFRFRNYMPDIGRFFGVDPIAEKFYYLSPYQTAHNNPIWKIELEGLEGEPGQGDDHVNDDEYYPSSDDYGDYAYEHDLETVVITASRDEAGTDEEQGDDSWWDWFNWDAFDASIWGDNRVEGGHATRSSREETRSHSWNASDWYSFNFDFKNWALNYVTDFVIWTADVVEFVADYWKERNKSDDNKEDNKDSDSSEAPAEPDDDTVKVKLYDFHVTDHYEYYSHSQVRKVNYRDSTVQSNDAKVVMERLAQDSINAYRERDDKRNNR